MVLPSLVVWLYGSIPASSAIAGGARRVAGVRVVNAGSVGMPYGAPGAHWLLLGPDVAFRRSDYDRAAAARRIRATGYPEAEDFAANNVLEPPSEAEALAAFAAREVEGSA